MFEAEALVRNWVAARRSEKQLTENPRCKGTYRNKLCNKKLGLRAARGTVIQCPKCKTVNHW